MYANAILKQRLLTFWASFGGRKNNGLGFPSGTKLQALIELAQVVIPYHNQQALIKRRDAFNDSKQKLHPWRRFGLCFVCLNPATVRHHIVQLQNGGINSKKNIVSLCETCHATIHPWL